MEGKVTWKDGMAFDAELDGFHFTIDADQQFGGRGLGPKPKGLTLVSLAGCTAMDVVSILGKMRVTLDSLDVSVQGTLADEHPKRFLKMIVRYTVTGKDVPLDKLKRAISLSEESYCGVRATLAPSVEIGHEIFLNGVRVDS